MPTLENGDRLPKLTADRVDGDAMTLPDDLDGWAVLVFYRGHW